MYKFDENGKLIIPKYATLVQLIPSVNGLVLPSISLNLSVNPIYLSLNIRSSVCLCDINCLEPF